jgi:hypothetical protein
MPDNREFEISEAAALPQLQFVFELMVKIGPTVELGSTSFGARRMVPITGGTVTGSLVSGRVLPGGADWQFIHDDGLTLVHARYVIQTDDDVCIEVRNRGIRHGSSDLMERIAAGKVVAPDEYYFRTTPCFYPPRGRYDWLRRSIFVGVGERYSDLVVVRVWSVA